MDTSTVIANIISIIFPIYILFCFAHGYFSNTSSNCGIKMSDKIDLGYIRVEPVPTKTQTQKVAVSSTKPDLKTECRRILVAIGYTPEVAKQMVTDFFKKDTAKDLEEFFVKINKP